METPKERQEMAAFTPELKAFYENRPMLWRNLSLLLVLNLGWAVSFTVVGPLMQLKVNTHGLGESGIGMLTSINLWAYSFLVMYFAWKSDHTVSRFGRRIPYLFISAPIIIMSVVLFPLFDWKWMLAGLWLLQMLFTDIKSATIPLLNIDCMPRRMLARTAAPAAVLTGLLSFFSLRYGMKLSDWSEWVPYLASAVILAATTLIGGLGIKEPPVEVPSGGRFRPWSAIVVAWRDRRVILLMVSVSMLQTFGLVYISWIWLFAKNELHLTRSESASALSWGIPVGMVAAFPAAWLIDRISPYRLLPIFCIVAGLVCWSSLNIHSNFDLVRTVCLAGILFPLYGAADIMVYRKAHPSEIGSVTSTNSFLRAAYGGLVMFLSGLLIEKSGGHYHYAFVAACILTFLGLIPLFIFRNLMRFGEDTSVEKKEDSVLMMDSKEMNSAA